MPFDLNKFIQGGLIWGGARPSKFDVQMTIPPTISGGSDPNGVVEKLNFTCKAASIPAFSVGEVLIPYFGRKIKSAGDRTWDDWQITVMLDEDYLTRNLFEAWSNQINALERNVMNTEGGSTTLPGEAYKTDWTITHYSKDNTPIAQYTLVGAWPRFVGAIQLDWDGTDRISEFNVTLAYDYMTPTSNTSSGSSIEPKGGQNITYTT